MFAKPLFSANLAPGNSLPLGCKLIVPPTTTAPAAIYGTMVPSIFGIIFSFVSPAMLPSLTGIT